MRLDWAEMRRSRWLWVALVLYAGLAALFVLVGLRESSVLGFTGMGRVLFSLCHALVLVLPLVALAASGQVVSRARDDGALELVLSHPVRRSAYLLGVTAVRYGALALPLVALLLALAVAGWVLLGQPVPWSFVARACLVSAALLWAFTALGLATSVHVRSPARVMTWLVVFWLAGVALLDFGLVGLMLSWRLEPRAVFLLASANPVQAARLALLSAAEPELANLGPVGFYLAHRFGQGALLALGIAWPVVFGALAWTAALVGLRRADAV
jgi:ABC-type transport system involved in multi-copper enzyme maturation permease subunit